MLPTSLLCQFKHVALKSPEITIRSGLWFGTSSVLALKFFQKVSHFSCVWLGDLYKEIKLQILFSITTLNLRISSANQNEELPIAVHFNRKCKFPLRLILSERSTVVKEQLKSTKFYHYYTFLHKDKLPK